MINNTMIAIIICGRLSYTDINHIQIIFYMIVSDIDKKCAYIGTFSVTIMKLIIINYSTFATFADSHLTKPI